MNAVCDGAEGERSSDAMSAACTVKIRGYVTDNKLQDELDEEVDVGGDEEKRDGEGMAR